MAQTRIDNKDIKKPLTEENVTLASGIDILPNVDGQSDLGSASYKFGTVYADNFVGSLSGSFVHITGDTMTGNLTIGSGANVYSAVSGLGNIGQPTIPFNNVFANALTVETLTVGGSGIDSRFVNVTGDTMTGNLLMTSGTLVRTSEIRGIDRSNPTNPTGTSQYLDIRSYKNYGSGYYSELELSGSTATLKGFESGSFDSSIKADGAGIVSKVNSFNKIILDGNTNITGNVVVAGDITPEASGTRNLGSAANPWLNIYGLSLAGPTGAYISIYGGQMDGDLNFASGVNLTFDDSGTSTIGTAAIPLGTLYVDNIVFSGSTGQYVHITGDSMTGPLEIQSTLSVGGDNLLPTAHSVAFGTNNAVSGSLSFVDGSGNTINNVSDRATIFGLNNSVIDGSTDAFVKGTGNSLYSGSARNKIFGDSNTISNNDVSIFGNNNTVNGGAYGSSVFGSNILLTNGAYNSFIVGANNTGTNGAYRTYIFGTGNIATNGAYESFIVGNSNITENSSYGNFIIGTNNTGTNGTTESIILGHGNLSTNTGFRNIILGASHSVGYVSENNVVGGRNNSYYSTTNSAMFGSGNSMSGVVTDLFIAGQSNSASSSTTHSAIFGYNNDLNSSSSYNIVAGRENSIQSNSTDNAVFGLDNDLTSASEKTIVAGSYNSGISAVDSVILGKSNTLTNSSTSAAIGSGNSIHGSKSIAIGTSISISGTGIVVLSDSQTTQISVSQTNSLHLRFENGLNLASGTNIIPGISGLQNIGTPARPFGTLYVDNIVSTGVQDGFVHTSGDTMTGKLTVTDGGITIQNGSLTVSSGSSVVSVGITNNIVGFGSVGFGNNNTAGLAGFGSSTAVGSYNNSNASNSTAVGYANLVSGDSAAAVGQANTVNGSYALGAGYSNAAAGFYSSSVGYSNVSSANSSSAVGNLNNAIANFSSAFGYLNSVSSTATYATAFGASNGVSGSRAAAFGYANTSRDDYSTSVGNSNIASGTRSTAVGYQNSAVSPDSSVFGHSNAASGNGVVVIGKGVTGTLDEVLYIGAPSGIIIQTGKNLTPQASGTQNIGSLQNTFQNVYANNIHTTGIIGDTTTLNFIIDGGGSVISSGSQGFVEMPQSYTPVSWNMFANLSGSLSVDVYRTTYASWSGTGNLTPSMSIVGSEKPTISGSFKNQDSALTTWSGLSAGDVLTFWVDQAPSNITKATLSIKLRRLS